MNRGGVMPQYSPVGWVYLGSGDCTIRWQRGDSVAYIFNGQQLETYPDEALRVKPLATIPVSSSGWGDAGDIRLAGENWVKTNLKRCPTCGGSR